MQRATVYEGDALVDLLHLYRSAVPAFGVTVPNEVDFIGGARPEASDALLRQTPRMTSAWA